MPLTCAPSYTSVNVHLVGHVSILVRTLTLMHTRTFQFVENIWSLLSNPVENLDARERAAKLRSTQLLPERRPIAHYSSCRPP